MKKTLRMKIILLLFALVVGSSNVWADIVTLTENFSSSKATNNQYDCTSEATTSGMQADWNYAWTPANTVFVFKSGIRLGKGSGTPNTGTVTNSTMLSGISAGTSITIKVYAARWNTDNGNLTVTYNNSSESKAPSNSSITSTSSTYSSSNFSSSTDFTITKVEDVTSFSIASSSKRIIIDKVEVVYSNGGGGGSDSSVTYTIASTTSVNVSSGMAPLGSTATFSQTYGTLFQMTGGNSMTLTISGCQGRTITGVVLSMRSNKSAGSGTLSITAGETTIASISPAAAFNSSSWNGAWSQTDFVDVTPTMSNSNYEVKSGEDVVITIAATANSLFCQSFTINYSTTTNDPMVFTLPSVQLVTNEEQTITTSADEAFSIASLNIESPTYTIDYCDEDGTVLNNNPYSWFSPSISTNKVVYSVEENTGEEDRTAYFKVYSTISGNKYYSALCSVTQKHQPHTYTLVDGSTVTLEAGKHYIIASGGSGTVKVMGAHSTDPTKNGYRTYIDDVTVTSKQITEKDGMYEVVFSGDNNNNWTMYDENYGLFICSTNSGGNITASSSISDNTKWTITISSGAATITAQGGSAPSFRYNSGSPRFTGYASGQSAVYLFKRDGDTDLEFHSPTKISSNLTIAPTETYTVLNGQSLEVTGTLTNSGGASHLVIEDGGQLITNNAVAATVKKNITGAGTENWAEESGAEGWYFIASPITTNNNPTEVDNLITKDGDDNTFDLYRYNNGADSGLSWENYIQHKDAAVNPFNLLVNGQGYLYANRDNVALSFSGTIQPSNANKTVNGLNDGFNLVGNPFTCNAYLDQSYYMLVGGNTISATPISQGTPIPPCTGVIIEGTSVTFSKDEIAESSANNGDLQIALAQTETLRGGAVTKTLDNAIVSFNEGSKLPKFYFGSQNANLYIPQDNEEYAIVSSSAQGEMPVNFRAYEAGEYTITVNPEEVDMGYLHLIDNIAGKDVDLIATPSYTFNARTDDYESRFRLVFSANGNENDNENQNFAFISNGQLIVNGTGTIQIIDIMGRVVSTRSTEERISTNGMTAGVYVLRLIGNDTKTQKIVIR